jgi:hypothetical protein
MSALKYLPKLYDALKALPQEKMTKQQLMRALEGTVSKNELNNSLPGLSSFPDNAPVLRSELQDAIRPHTYKVDSRTGEGDGTYLADEFSPDEDAIVEDAGEAVMRMAREERPAYHADGTRAHTENIDSLLPIATKEQRQKLLDETADYFENDAAARRFVESNDPEARAHVINKLNEYEFNIYDNPKFTEDLKFATSDGKMFDYADEAYDRGSTLFNARVDDMGLMEQGTGYGQYTTPGPKSDYTENLTKMQHPDGDTLPTQFNERHFDNAENTVFHTRSSTRTPLTTPTNTTPEPVLYGEELQSEWAKAHKRQMERYAKDKEAYDRWMSSHEAYTESLEDIKPHILRGLEYNGSSTRRDHFLDHSDFGRTITLPRPEGTEPGRWDEDALWNAYKERDMQNRLGSAHIQPPTPPTLPPSPLQDGWEDYALRQLVAEAIDKNLPGVAIATGKANAARYPGMDEKDAAGLTSFYDNKIRNKLSKLAKKYKTPLTTVDIPTTDDTRFMYHPDTTRVEDTLFGPRVVTPKGALDGLPNTADNTKLAEVRAQHQMRNPEMSDYMMRQGLEDKAYVDQYYNDKIERAPYLQISPQMREAIKKGLPLSILATIGAQE